MPLWDDLDFQAQVRLTLECVPLSPAQYEQVMAEWSGGNYPDNWQGHNQAIADLLKLARWTSLSATQQKDEQDRNALYVKDKSI